MALLVVAQDEKTLLLERKVGWKTCERQPLMMLLHAERSEDIVDFSLQPAGKSTRTRVIPGFPGVVSGVLQQAREDGLRCGRGRAEEPVDDCGVDIRSERCLLEALEHGHETAEQVTGLCVGRIHSRGQLLMLEVSSKD